MQRLEWLRITSRSAPMLGLVATMIPMGPALLALTRNDAQGIGENLVVAFSAVILALVAASITFFILTVRRRWLLQEAVYGPPIPARPSSFVAKTNLRNMPSGH